MTRFTVAWLRSAQDELLSLWLEAENRQEISNAGNGIDRELRHDADLKGTVRADGLRSLSISPLRVIFNVRENDRLVTVLRVRRI